MIRACRMGLVAAVAALPAPAGAQVTSSLVAGSEVLASSGERWRPWTALGATLGFDRSWLSLSADGAAVTDGERWDSRGSIGAHLVSPTLGPVQLSVSGSLLRAGEQFVGPDWSAAGHARASVRRGRWGMWAGVDARSAAADSMRELATPVIGGWRELGDAILSISLAPRRLRAPGSPARVWEEMRRDSLWQDTLGGWTYFDVPVVMGDSGSAARTLRWDQAEARLFWSRGRLAADATLGGRVAGDFGTALWGAVSGLYVLTPRVVVVAGAGSRPGEPSSGWRRRSFATLGVRLLGPPEPAHRPPPEIRPGAADFRLVPARAGAWTISVRVPHARTVEISGDFTDWEPLMLQRVGLDRWEVTVAVVPGTHHVNVRVNGDRWMAPPGLPEVDDEFNGTVGLLVVP